MQPLTKKQRRITLFLMIVAFLVVGPWIVFNSFGYKLDDALGFVRTGGIYIHSDIANAEVYIDGEFIENNGVLIRNTLVQKLKPEQTYSVRFSKEGYRPWKKDIYVYPGLVSEARVLMLPNEILIEQVFPFFDKEDVGTTTAATTTPKTKSGEYIPQNKEYIEIIVLFDGENPYVEEKEIRKNSLSAGRQGNQILPVLEEKVATTTKEELPDYLTELGIIDLDEVDNFIETTKEVSWLREGNIVLNWVDDIDSIPYFYCTGDEKRVCESEIVLDWTNDIEKFEYFPGRNDVWLVLVKNEIYAVEIDTRSQRNIQFIYKGQDLDFVKKSSGGIVVRDGGQFFKLEL
jgi:hypothetical protein